LLYRLIFYNKVALSPAALLHYHSVTLPLYHIIYSL
jgi:hypothetical protein